MPQLTGSIRPSAAFAAIAASTALPPAFSTSTPICVASGWLVQTKPCCARTSERVANGRPVMRSTCARAAVGSPHRSAATIGNRQRFMSFMASR
jgi:hypothetical protein